MRRFEAQLLQQSELEEAARRIDREGRCLLGPLLRACWHCRPLRPLIYRVLCAMEGGVMLSQALREILRGQYQVEVGMYSYGSCLRPGNLPPGTRIGNYCSIGDGLTVLRRNHPSERLSLHPFFFNSQLGLVREDTIPAVAENPLAVGHDVWIGANVTIAPGCGRIGNGAVVAAGAVLTRDVPSFAIVGGVQAKLIRWRFPPDVQCCIEASKWWLLPLSELVNNMSLFQQPMNTDLASLLKEALGRKADASERDL